MPEPRRLHRPQLAESEEEAPRRLRRERDEEEPRSRRPGRSEADDDTGLAVAKGWSGYRRTKANAPSPWTKLYKVENEEKIIMFLEDGPYASFLMHWAEWVPKGQKMSYVCLQDRCPLDAVDPKPQARVRFNILDCQGDQPIIVTFETGVSVTEMLEEYAEDEPLSGQYFAVAMKGPKNAKRTQIRPIKIRDLKDDWEFVALTEDEIEAFGSRLLDDTSLEINTRAELQKVADAFNE
jgi:hypothetical protein